MQHGQIFELKTTGPDGERLWAYRFRLDGRGSRRIQRGGYASADDAREALQRALTAAQRRKGRARMTLADLAEEYLAQHDAEPHDDGQAALAAASGALSLFGRLDRVQSPASCGADR